MGLEKVAQAVNLGCLHVRSGSLQGAHMQASICRSAGEEPQWTETLYLSEDSLSEIWQKSLLEESCSSSLDHLLIPRASLCSRSMAHS